MLYGVFSDVHSNLEALTAVLNNFKRLKVEGFIFCGDFIGYGPNPNECVKLISELKNVHAIMGNHDAVLFGKSDVSKFTDAARFAIEYTQSVINDKSKNFLSSLYSSKVYGDFTVAHGSPRNPLDEYLVVGEQFLESLNFWNTQVCFVGHTHIPLAFKQKGEAFPIGKVMKENDTVLIEQNSRYIFNPGSVGQPRDRNPKASCALYDSGKHIFKNIRVEYDYKTTQQKMRKLDFPALLINRLEKGQ